MSNNGKIGVITEQGFAAGEGLGFNPINEKDLKMKKDEKDKTTTKSNSSNKSDKKDK